MWRIFQGIPRAFRTQWCNHARNAPQAVNHEEEAELEHCLHPPSVLCTSTHSAALEGNEEKSDEGRHRHGFGHEERWGANRFRECCDPDYCTQVEAFGWGAALLVSLRLSLGWQRERKAIYSGRDRHWFKNETFMLPALGSEHLSTRNSILVESSQKYQENSIRHEGRIEEDIELPPSEEVEARDSVVQPLYDVVHEIGEEISLSKEAESDHKTLNDPLKQAVNDWESLTLLYTNMKHNRIATKMANKENFSEALVLWDHASMKGYAKASHNLGVCYETGKGVPVDMAKAAKCYHRAASQGCAKSLYNLSLMYIEGCGVSQDKNKAKQLMERAAELGLKQAQTELGVMYTERSHRDMAKAASLFSLAAKQDDSAAQYYLGVCYEQGLGVPCNPCKAAELYRQSANAGYISAYRNLAKLFDRGAAGLPEDKTEALKLYEMAANGGCEASERAALKLKLQRFPVKDDKTDDKTTQPLSIYLSQVLNGFGRFSDNTIDFSCRASPSEHQHNLSVQQPEASLSELQEMCVVSCT